MGNNATRVLGRADELTDRTHLTEVEIENLLSLYRAHGNSAGKPIDLEKFRELLMEIHKSYPHQAFTQQCAELTYNMLNTEKGKVGPEQVVLGVSALVHGTDRERGELIFKSMDYNKCGFLSRTAVIRRTDLVVILCARIIERDINMMGSFSRINMGIALKGAKAALKRELVAQVFTADLDGDDRLSLEEWLNAIDGGHEVITALGDPAATMSFVIELLKETGEQKELGNRIMRAAKKTMRGVQELADGAKELMEQHGQEVHGGQGTLLDRGEAQPNASGAGNLWGHGV